MKLRTGAMLLAVLMGGAVGGCGSKTVSKGETCGAGTVDQNGQCVPASTVTCGAGTMLINGHCEVACGPGTVLKNGQCVVADAICGPGTMLVNGQCQPANPLGQVTVPEAAEPNDSSAQAAKFTLPAVGASPVVLGGTVAAVDSGTPDFDWFIFDATAQQRIHVEATAVGAPSIGVIVVPVTDDGTDAPPIQRLVLSLDSRTATRDIVLPIGGTWALKVSDADNLGISQSPPSGGATFTYLVKVSQVAPSSAMPLDTSMPVDGALSAGDVFQLSASGSDLPIVDVSLGAPAGTAPFRGVRTLWAVDSAGKLVFNVSDNVLLDGSVQPMPTQRILLPAGGLTVGVDYVYALEAPGGYELTAKPLQTKQVTNVGSGQTYSDSDSLPNDEKRTRIYSLQLPPESFIDAVLTPSWPYDLQPRIEFRDAQFNLVATTPTSSDSAELHAYIPTGKEGLYFLLVMDASILPTDTDLSYTFTLDEVQAAALPALTPPGNATLTAPLSKTGPIYSLPFAGTGLVRLTLTPPSSVAIGATLATDTGKILQSIWPTSSPGMPVVIDNLPIFQPERLLLTVNAPAMSMGNVKLQVDAAAATFVAETGTNTSLGLAQAVPIDPITPTVITGAFANGLDGHWYGFNLPFGGSVSVALTAGPKGGLVSANLHIDDHSGNSLQEATSYSGTTTVNASNLGPGNYFIEMEPFFGSPADYTLVLQQTP